MGHPTSGTSIETVRGRHRVALVLLTLAAGLLAAAPALAHSSPAALRANVALTHGRVTGWVLIANHSSHPTHATHAAIVWQTATSVSALGTLALPRLAARRSRRVTVDVAVPAASAAGSHAVWICVGRSSPPRASKLGRDCVQAGVVTIAPPLPAPSTLTTPSPAPAVVAPASIGSPTLSGTPEDAETLTVAPGSWSGSAPLSYAYQWERCNSSGASCQPIAGATAATYTAAAADIGDTLVGVVTASNSAGSASAASAASGVVASSFSAPAEDTCDMSQLPAPSPAPAANTLIINGEIAAAGQEANYASLANANVTVAFRSVPDASGAGYPGGTFSYAPPAANTQVGYWQANGYPFFYTAVASDFPGHSLPLFIAQCDGEAALRMSADAGLYVHELVTYYAENDTGWNWTQAVDDITTAEWRELDYWVQLAAALNKKVIWNEPALGWQALAANATAQSYFSQPDWRATLVPTFASNFDSESAGYLMATARASAAQVATTYGMGLGESVQSWWFRDQTDLGAQESAGLPTSGADGTPPAVGSCSSQTQSDVGYELDPLNTDSYAASYDGNDGCFGDPLNGTDQEQEPSLAPGATDTLALANFGAIAGAHYFEVEGADGTYEVAGGSVAYTAVDDMAWSPLADPSPFMQGIQAFASQLGAGSPSPSEPATVPLYQLWNGSISSHYYTTTVNSSGTPLQPDGTAATNCNGSSPTPYCYQNTPAGASTPVPAGYLASSQVSGSVALSEYSKGTTNPTYFYTTGASGPTGFSKVGGPLGYVMQAELPGTEPLYQLYAVDWGGREDYFFTTDAGQRTSALGATYNSAFIYVDQGVAAYLFTYASTPQG
ncbi:MAG: hypothetical protein ABSC56_13995 [Solirubrobacteraceae bacterium]|jgi:hypothetical protein